MADQDQTPPPPPAPDGMTRMQALQSGARPAGGLVELLGFEVGAVAPGRMTFTGTPDPTHYNPGGTVHGGYVAALLDSAMGFAAHTVLEAGQGCTTLELKISYLRAVTQATGPVTASGVVIRHGRRVVFTEATLTDSAGRALASASSTLLVVERQHGNGGA